MRTVCLASALLLLPVIGCPPGPRTVIDPFPGEPVDGLTIGELKDGVFVPYEPGDDAAWEYGGQGGTMITPVLAMPAAMAGEERIVQVTLTNTPDPAFPDAQGELAEFTGMTSYEDLVEDGDLVRTARVFDQVAWDDPEGTRLLLGATARGEEFAVSTDPIALRVSNESAETVCDELETEGSGCVYRRVPGSVFIASVDDGQGSCPDPQSVWFSFTPTDDRHEICADDGNARLTMPGGESPPLGCLDDIGVAAASIVPAVQLVSIAGTCTPVLYEFDLDWTACEALCAR